MRPVLRRTSLSNTTSCSSQPSASHLHLGTGLNEVCSCLGGTRTVHTNWSLLGSGQGGKRDLALIRWAILASFYAKTSRSDYG